MAPRKLPPVRNGIPAPGTPEGELFHYQPTEAEIWLPFSARKLSLMAFAREIPHVNNGNKIWFSGINIREISKQFTVQPLSAAKRPRAAA